MGCYKAINVALYLYGCGSLPPFELFGGILEAFQFGMLASEQQWRLPITSLTS